ncbi:uncharacterized protein LOC122960334 isoform X1 [Acropora millepora]|uniref:uncharacterized protein LOC122960334 isoform X1 n=1 Tax=Acropora millepora TaxID=45264 RepID=UPI001CF324E4|nr:uncharacterized protein LOC122960334 isoform X1 [Acropora millepora]XP_044178403.1 uncharacterized protein LOC122960334 isoform X1 [Acropora millepora]XP_044178404.1 uncharacterized protein LOC122960334 isoform X1 [Acropora millepora]
MASFSRQPQVYDRTIKVTILASEWGSSKGGLSTINRELAIQLAKFSNVKVTFFLPKCSLENKAIALSHGISIIQAERGYEELDWLSFPPKDLKIDVVVGHGVKLGKQAQVIRESHKCKWVQVVHTDPEKLGMYKCYENPIAKGEQKHSVEVELCQMSDLVVGVGPKLTEAFRKYLRWCKKDQNVFEFTPGVFADFASVEQAHDEREDHSVLVFGRGDDEDFELKGFDIAARSVAALPDTHLVFVGAPDGKEQEIAKRLLDSGIPKERLTVRGFKDREALKREFCEADLVLMPSRTEGFGLTALEAMSAGLPVIVSKNSGFGEALDRVPFGSSFVIDSEDPSAWTAAIKGTWDKDRRTRLDETKVLRSYYGKRYRWSEQCANLLEKMASLLENRQDAFGRSQISVQEGVERRSISIEDRTGEASTPAAEGDTLPKVIQSYEESLCIAREADDRATEGYIYFHLGKVYESHRDLPKAIDCYEKALTNAGKAGDRTTEADTYFQLGSVYNSRGDHPRAIECYEKSLHLSRGKGARKEGIVCLSLGKLYESQIDVPKAIECYEKASNVARKANDRKIGGMAFLNLGILYSSSPSDLPKAMECLEKASNNAKEAGDREIEGKAYLNLGLVYYESCSDLPKGMECLEKALNCAREAGDRNGEASAYFGLSAVYSSSKDLPKAIECSEKALHIVTEGGHPANKAELYQSLGILYHHNNDLPKAIDCWEKASNIAREAGDWDTEVKAYCHLGTAYRDRDNLPKAIECYEKGLNIATKTGDELVIFRACEVLERCHLALGNVLKASEYRKRSSSNRVVALTEEPTEGSACNLQVTPVE